MIIMNLFPKKKENGMAMLESAFVFMILTMMLLGGIVTAERFEQFSRATKMVEKYIHEDSFRPLRLATNELGHFELTVKHNELDQYLNSIIGRAAEEVSQTLAAKGLRQAYFIESSYAVIPIHPETGEVVGGLNSFTCKIRSGQGDLADPTCRTILSAFELLSQQKLSQQGNRAAFAVPSVLAARDGVETSYLPFAVLVGMRLGWELESGFSGDIGESLGLSRNVSDFKVAVLRGDVEL